MQSQSHRTTGVLAHPPRPTRERGQVAALLTLRRNPLELWGEPAYREEILGGRFLGRDQLVVNAPEGIRRVLVENHENYRRSSTTRRLLSPLLGEGLFLAEGEAWRHQRRTIAPSMNPRTLPMLARHVAIETESALDRLLPPSAVGRPGGGARVIELLPVLQNLALSIAARSMFSLESDEFAHDLRTLAFRYGTTLATPGPFDILLPERMPAPLDGQRQRFREEWLALIDRVIDRREATPPAEDGARDLFDMLASARDPQTGRGFDRAQLRDEVATMILAGHETTAVTLFWACYAAASLDGAQDAIADEAASVPLGPDAAGAALGRLPLARAHVEEALRLYPPAFMIVREAVRADTICGREVPAGAVITISPWLTGRHHRRWRDPDRFDASRFLPGAPVPDRFAYLPFGIGPRICVGMGFAMTEAVLVIASVLARFRLRLAPGAAAVLPRGIVTTQPDRPVRFFVEARADVAQDARADAA